jgi:hypothetical protein
MSTKRGNETEKTGRVTHIRRKVHGEVCSREAGEEREDSRHERPIPPYGVREMVLPFKEQEGEQGGDGLGM